MTTTEMNFKLKKLKNKSLRKLIISSFQLLLILFAVLGIVLILRNVVQPIFNEVKNSEDLFKNFNRIVQELEGITEPEKLFASDGYFILPDLTNIKPEDLPIFQEGVKNAFLKFQGDFDQILQQLNNLEPDKIFTQANGLITDVLKIIPEFGENLGIRMGPKSQIIIDNVSNLQKLANNINDLTTDWLSMPFDKILEIFQNNSQNGPSSDNWQTVLNENLDTIIKSKLAIMLIIILVSLVVVILFLLWLIPSAFKMKVSNWRLDEEQKIPGILTTINILFAFIFVLGPISWFLINRSFNYKYNKSLKN